MPIDRQGFFAGAKSLFGGRYTRDQVDGLNAILDEWEQRSPNGDPRWLAYMLATAFHETARTMQPVREAFWLSEQWRRNNLRYYPFYGRGYVQLTWEDNYRKASDVLGVDLVARPDEALRPDHAAVIMFVGMEEGWFRADRNGRRQTLGRYFGRNADDPVGAREIINGRERKTVNGRAVLIAEVIARYHATFLDALSGRPAMVAAAGATLLALAEDAGTAVPADGRLVLRDDPLDIAQWVAASDVPVQSSDRLMRYTVEIVTGYLNNNALAPRDVPAFIADVHAALRSAAGDATFDPALDAVEGRLAAADEAGPGGDREGNGGGTQAPRRRKARTADGEGDAARS